MSEEKSSCKCWPYHDYEDDVDDRLQSNQVVERCLALCVMYKYTPSATR